MRTRIAIAISTAVSCAAAVGLGTSAADADLTTRCVGEGGPVTVPGDLVVPAGESCHLAGTTVEGAVRVDPGGNLVVEDGILLGRVTIANDAYLDATASTVDGPVTLRPDAYGVDLEATEIGGSIIGQAGSEGFVRLIDSSVAGQLRSRAGAVLLDGSSVTGSVVADQTRYADVYDSFVDGGISVRDTELGGVLCGSAVKRAVTYAGNAGTVQLGGNGPLVGCGVGGYVGTDVTVQDNTATVVVDQTIVDGDIRLTDNDPVAGVGAANLVRGDLIGEYDDVPPVDSMVRRPERTDRGGDLMDRADERRSTALTDAAAAGDAGL